MALCRVQATPRNIYWTIDPFSGPSVKWRLFVTVFDAIYSAFLLPISVGWHEWLTWFTWFNVLDFIGSESHSFAWM